MNSDLTSFWHHRCLIQFATSCLSFTDLGRKISRLSVRSWCRSSSGLTCPPSVSQGKRCVSQKNQNISIISTTGEKVCISIKSKHLNPQYHREKVCISIKTKHLGPQYHREKLCISIKSKHLGPQYRRENVYILMKSKYLGAQYHREKAFISIELKLFSPRCHR